MDISRILQSRVNRKTRLGKPFSVFQDSFSECHEAARSILDGEISSFTNLLERSVIITMVTAIEVYYKDVLDGIFRICSPEFFQPQLKKIHGTKYDIVDLIEIYKKQVHPLELVSANQSFQNIDTINAIFSKFLGRSLWSSVIGMEVRVKEEPEKNGSFTHEDLDALKALFLLRHEIVHSPGKKSFLTEQVIDNAIHASWLVFGSDIVLMRMITDNQDPSINLKSSNA